MFKDFCQLLISMHARHVQLLNILPPYEQLEQFERRLAERGKLTFDRIFKEPLGNYILRQYLMKFGCVAQAVFLEDATTYQTLTSENARTRLSKFIFLQFLAPMSVNHESHRSAFSLDFQAPGPPFLDHNAVGIK